MVYRKLLPYSPLYTGEIATGFVVKGFIIHGKGSVPKGFEGKAKTKTFSCI